jgi:hypothetical protein
VWYLLNKQRKLAEIRDGVVRGGLLVLLLTALTPFLFYLLVYFMKAGYLLNVLPSIVLLGALMVDELAIAYAKKQKQLEENRFALTRRMITKRAVAITAGVSIVNILWFTLPLPGKGYWQFVDGFTAVSFGNDLSDRVKEGNSFERLLNRAFAYTSAQGISNVDRINEALISAISSQNGAVTILDTWWSRWNYIYSPQHPVYDIITFGDRLQMGYSRQHDRVPLNASMIELPHTEQTLLIIRPDHPDLKLLASQAELTPIDSVIGIYRVTPNTREIKWKDKTFRFGER